LEIADRADCQSIKGGEMERRHASLYGDCLKDAVCLDNPWLNSEKLPEYRKFFVGRDLLNQFLNNENQLIVGRRGTGKTHLLGAINETLNSEDGGRILSILISLLEVFESPPEEFSESVEHQRQKVSHFMFEQFVYQFVDRLVALVQARYLEKLSPKARSEVETKLLELMEMVEQTVLLRDMSELHIRESESILRVTKRQIGKPKRRRTRYPAGASRPRTPNVAKVKNKIAEIMQCLGIKTIYILVDEWMQIDKTLRMGIQPYFAELLKRMFFSEKYFSVKIASIWHQTNLYSREDVRISRGLKLGDDIHLGTDLDTYFITDWNMLHNFFKELLFKRLSYKSPDLMQLKVNGRVDDMFLTELFDNVENFRELVLATHGIPRDFLRVFHKCSLRIKHNFRDYAITKDMIRVVVKDLFVTEKRKAIDKSAPWQKLLDKISAYVDQTGHRYFLIENKVVDSSVTLRKLLDERLIHPIPSSSTPREWRNTHKCFVIDYGNYLDWCSSKGIDITVHLKQDFIPKFGGEFSDCVLDISAEEEAVTVCGHCGHTFSRMEPSFLKKGLCPNCFEEV
jgi:hypothetical protein